LAETRVEVSGIVNWAAELGAQLDRHWTNQLRPRLQGLGDHEYFWEPVASCWTVRPVGGGKFMADFQFPPPDPPPVTTIAWRLSHIASGIFAKRNANHFGGPAFDIHTFDWPGTAQAALDMIDTGYAHWKAGVETLDEEALARDVGHVEPWPAPMSALILHINREIIHHGAEVALLRDLYRASNSGPSPLSPPS
jgi:DinB superfamily